MKKTISGVLLALASVCALAACKKDDKKTTAGSGSKDVVANGKVINFYCWNNEFQTRLRKYYPSYEKNLSAQADLLKDGTTIMWTMVANEGGSYQTALDAALTSDSVDMFVFEADYATKYVDSKYVVAMEDLGILADMAGQYKYTKDVVTNKAGKIVGSSWQGCPGCICYNTNVVKAAEMTDAAVETALNTSFDTFKQLAADLEAKSTAEKDFAIMIGYADWYRTYSNNLSAKMWDGTTLKADKNLFQWAKDTKEFNDAGYLLGDTSGFGLWGGDWGKGMAANSNALCVFACPWFTDFSLKDFCKVEAGQSSPYKVVKGYNSWFWGGTWLTATTEGIKDATKKAAITDIIKQMTTNKDVLLALSKGELDFTNNQEAMEALAKDSSANNAYFNGQNVYAIYAESVLKADLSKASDYDQYISEEMQNKFLPYIQGESDASACWTEFVKIISEKTKQTIVLPDGVTLAADITIA